MEAILVMVTASSEEEAAGIGRTLVEERLAACANVIPGIRSLYSWEGNLNDEGEVLILMKSRRSHFPRLEERVKQLHGYAVPEIIAVPIVEGSEDYLAWVEASTS